MAGALTISTLNDSSGVLATQNGMTGICKAWVQWAGSSGTIAGSFNVSSVTRSAQGQYTINFTTAMPNANYSAVSGGCVDTSASAFLDPIMFAIAASPFYQAPTTSSCTVRYVGSTTGTAYDPVYGNIAIFSS